jgi:hypothetical protein
MMPGTCRFDPPIETRSHGQVSDFGSLETSLQRLLYSQSYDGISVKHSTPVSLTGFKGPIIKEGGNLGPPYATP